MNAESIVGKHFKEFYCRQLKNEQLNEMSATVSEMWKMCFSAFC